MKKEKKAEKNIWGKKNEEQRVLCRIPKQSILWVYVYEAK